MALPEDVLRQFIPTIEAHVREYLGRARPEFTLHEAKTSRYVSRDPQKSTLMFVIGAGESHIEAVFVSVTAEYTLDDIAHLVESAAVRALSHPRRTIR